MCDEQFTKLNSELRSINLDGGNIVKSNLHRTGSFHTQKLLSSDSTITSSSVKFEMSERLLTIFSRFDDDLVQSYFWSKDYARDFLSLCERVKSVFKTESPVLDIRGATHVFGDVHGNIDDLFFFRDNVWPNGMELTAGKFLFLGDYVDRGICGLEVLTYLFACKTLYPKKVFMIRGNHELRSVNGWEAHYGAKCLLAQCKQRFGKKNGHLIWEAANSVFDFLPVAATLDNDVFCTHGGIPRCLVSKQSRMDILKQVSGGATKECIEEQKESKDLLSDLLWGDPTDGKTALVDKNGFAEGSRGGSACMFTQQAVDEFFLEHGFSLMLRAHQACEDGVSVTMKGKVVTVFSTSKDHGMGNESSCAYLVYEDKQLIAINRFTKAHKQLTPVEVNSLSAA